MNLLDNKDKIKEGVMVAGQRTIYARFRFYRAMVLTIDGDATPALNRRKESKFWKKGK